MNTTNHKSGEDSNNYKHGYWGTRLYSLWNAMHNRCRNLSILDKNHFHYIGISVCEEWQTFEPFRDWALNNGYKDDLTLDRKDGKKNYEPSNCRWATYSEQLINRRAYGKSMFRGVCKSKAYWLAQYTVEGKSKYIGIFKTELEASLAYDEIMFKTYGLNRKLNFPERFKKWA